MWNDTDIPLTYLITFHCYGTWVHGDERSSVDRFHNVYGTPRIEPNKKWQQYNQQHMKYASIELNAKPRLSVEIAIRETCNIRDWHLYAINVRTNHIHTVVSIGMVKPEITLSAFKANATRQMHEDGFWQHEHSPWVVKGSKKYLWNECSVERGIDYVINGQGDDLPNFD